jgi:hypothetical protein
VNRQYLGDALDFWKGTMLALLRRSCVPARAVKILPMLTDGADWAAAEVETYATLLGAAREDIGSLRQFVTAAERRVYFALHVESADDLFLDPDTGVACGRPGRKHVTAEDVHSLLSRSNVVAIYQHRPQRSPASGWLARYRHLLLTDCVLVTGYESAQVGMLFATRSAARDRRLRQVLATRLGAVATVRGTFSPRLL